AGLLRPLQQQVGTSPLRGLEGPCPSPALDPGMVPGEKNLWHREAAELPRPGVMRVIEAIRRERLPLDGFGARDDAADEPREGFDHREGRGLASREDKVPE